MFKHLEKKLEKVYKENGQYLPFESHYLDEGKLTEQEICIIDQKKNKCILCTRI